MDTVDEKKLENKEKSKPERMCVCCRRKGEKSEFFRISEQNGKYIFDREMKVQARGFYVCKTNECVERLSKNRKYNIEIEQLVKMLEQIKCEKKNIIDIGHYTESLVKDLLLDYISELNVEVIKSTVEKSPFTIL